MSEGGGETKARGAAGRGGLARAAVVLAVLLGPCIVAFPREIRVRGGGDVDQMSPPVWERVEPYFDAYSHRIEGMGARKRDLYVVRDWSAAAARTGAMLPVALLAWAFLNRRKRGRGSDA